MAIKPALPKGTRDILPWELIQRNYIMDTIRGVLEQYGFLPIETPAMENLSTLTGKYGEEGDRLIFKILNSGDFLKKLPSEVRQSDAPVQWTPHISEKALRYDLTVPFARFVAQHQNDLVFPFKRYQIQPVWRADRPQKGRYREFYQCDADVVGSPSLLLEIDFIEMYAAVFQALQLPVVIKINHRKVLAGLAQHFGIAERLTEFTVALDKIDKIGLPGVLDELAAKNFPEVACQGLQQLWQRSQKEEVLPLLEEMLSQNEMGRAGAAELRFMMEQLPTYDKAVQVQVDLTLARGLDYYTGAIFEVLARDVELGSVGGGGRYDDLTGIFGMKDLSGVGISFGIDRILLALTEKDLLPPARYGNTEVLFVNFGESESVYCTALARDLRSLGVRTQVYPHAAKLKKQMDYANRNNIHTVILIGEQEIEQGRFTVKNMEAGSQQQLSRIELLEQYHHRSEAGSHGGH